jgi:hypothetical protein
MKHLNSFSGFLTEQEDLESFVKRLGLMKTDLFSDLESLHRSNPARWGEPSRLWQGGVKFNIHGYLPKVHPYRPDLSLEDDTALVRVLHTGALSLDVSYGDGESRPLSLTWYYNGPIEIDDSQRLIEALDSFTGEESELWWHN